MKPPFKNLDELRSGTVDEYIEYVRERSHRTELPPDVLEIWYLICAFDGFQGLEIEEHNWFVGKDDWQPKTKQTRDAIDRLIAPQNRKALRAYWVALRGKPLNSGAKDLMRYLSKASGEDFGD